LLPSNCNRKQSLLEETVNERQITIHTSRRKIVLHLWWNTNKKRILEGTNNDIVLYYVVGFWGGRGN